MDGVLKYARYRVLREHVKTPGIECGVFNGDSAFEMLDALGTGKDFHLLDSFEGFRRITEKDLVGTSAGRGITFAIPGTFKTNSDAVVQRLSQFNPTFHMGFIPEILPSLPEKKWKFVHLDLDLYESTYRALEYFLPRMADGGVIIEDDYQSEKYPGVRRAWDSLVDDFEVLETGQAKWVR